MFNNLTVVYSLTDKNFKIDGEPKVWIDQTRNLLPSQAEERDRQRRREGECGSDIEKKIVKKASVGMATFADPLVTFEQSSCCGMLVKN